MKKIKLKIDPPDLDRYIIRDWVKEDADQYDVYVCHSGLRDWWDFLLPSNKENARLQLILSMTPTESSYKAQLAEGIDDYTIRVLDPLTSKWILTDIYSSFYDDICDLLKGKNQKYFYIGLEIFPDE